jgi:nucleotide-binding universal stress UspA family protein
VGIRDGDAPPDLPDIIKEHGLQAELLVLPIRSDRPFGETLLTGAHMIGADILVMGAYAHNPIQEFVLGGVTRFMLAHADLPVLMRH